MPPTFFADQLVGYGAAIERFASETLADGGLRNFYQRFVESTGKPLILAETAAPWIVGAPATATEVQVKQAWWKQIYSPSTFQRFPMLKAVIHFDELKTDGNGVSRDWRILHNSNLVSAFKADMSQLSSSVLFAQQLSFKCGGQVQIVS